MANEHQVQLDRVLSRVRKLASGCWEFAGGTCNGYGWVSGKYAHRVVLVHTQGDRQNADARHLCGNKLCCHPDHLAWGTRAENEADKIGHGRSNRGERQGRAKLTAAHVRDIRARVVAETQTELAREYGIDPSTVSQIVNRKRWAWL